MVDNHAARTADQAPEVGGKSRWVSKVVIFVVFAGIVAALVLLT